MMDKKNAMPWRQQRAIALPLSSRETAAQMTVVDHSGSRSLPGRCACGAVIERKSSFCGYCGVGLYEVVVSMASH